MIVHIEIRNKFPNSRFKDPHELTDLSMSALNKGIVKATLEEKYKKAAAK